MTALLTTSTTPDLRWREDTLVDIVMAVEYGNNVDRRNASGGSYCRVVTPTECPMYQ